MRDRMQSRLISRIAISLSVSIMNICCQQPVDATESSIIFTSSFELDGQPSINGWRLPPGENYTSFVDQAPPEGGKWSLRLSPGRPPSEGYIEKVLSGINRTGIFKSSVWTTTNDQIQGSSVSLSQIRNNETINANTTSNFTYEWAKIILIDTLEIIPSDTIIIKLSAGGAEISTAIILFDLVTFEQVEQ